jgi:hypothetical protein
MRVVRRLWRGRTLVAYVALATSLVAHVRWFYHPGTGFSSLIWFGEQFAAGRIGDLTETPVYTYPAAGYDGQFYAQLAVAGNPFDPALRAALDSPSYRSRRVLLPLVTYLLGGGNPARVVNIYALANVGVWLLLAFLLARWWFPPTDLHNLVRWAGTLFGVGVIISLARSLVDAPALLLVACGVRAIEQNRRVLGAALLGAAGLTRETSVIAAAALAPPRERRGAREWARAGLLVALAVSPAAIWILVLRLHHGYLGGTRNFAVPLGGFVEKLGELRDGWRAGGFGRVHHEIWVVLSLATQVAFLLSRRRLAEPWGRVGAAFALFALMLGWPVWEGNLSAVTRVVLPMTLAFNVLVPRTRRGLALLLAGNLTVLSAPGAFRPPRAATESFAAGDVTANYATGWYALETDWTSLEAKSTRRWRWSSGLATLALQNGAPAERTVTIDFRMWSVVDRTVVIRIGAVEKKVVMRPQIPVQVQLAPVVLRPGTTALLFRTDAPPWPEPGVVERRLAFSVEDLSVR